VEPVDDFGDILFSNSNDLTVSGDTQDNPSSWFEEVTSGSADLAEDYFDFQNTIDSRTAPKISISANSTVLTDNIADYSTSSHYFNNNVMESSHQTLETSDTETIRKARAAAACRKTRLKRKNEQLELDARNEELLREQEKFRAEIATLQSEIQHLKKYSQYGGIDLKTQNLLLRAEVKRHKTFVNHIKCMISNIPQYTSLEKLKLANEGIESTIGQVIGMCYTSVLDRSWQIVEYKPNVKQMEGVKIVCRYQFLPEGSTPENATRLNFRTDVYNMPIACDKMKGVCSNLDPKVEKEYRQKYMDLVEGEMEMQSIIDFELDKLDMDFRVLGLSESSEQKPDVVSLSSNENIPLTDAERSSLRPLKVYRYRETRKPLVGEPHQAMEKIELRSCIDKISVNAFGFPRSKDAKNFLANSKSKQHSFGNGETGNRSPEKLEVFLAVTSEASHEVGPILKPTDTGVVRFQESFIEGHVFREGEKGPEFTDTTEVKSFPLLTGNCFCEYDRKILTAFENSPNATPTRIPSKIRIDSEIMADFVGCLLATTNI